MYLISPEIKQYKANLHCHSILSDGKKTPEELKELYKSQGYHILAITDHERPRCHTYLTDENFMMITGYECYIRNNPQGKYDTFAREIHLNLFAREPDNIKMICCNETYCHYLRRDNAISELTRVGSERVREYTTEYINDYIRQAKEHGYIVAHNHPYWSMEMEERILSYEGLFSIEMCNYGSYVTNHIEHNGAIYDKLLSVGKRIACHGADDNHNKFPIDSPYSDSFGAFTMIYPEEFTYTGVINAMENGQMYSSMGPVFKEISVNGNKVHIECSEVKHIFMYVGSKTPCNAHAQEGEYLTSVDFEIDDRAQYIRISIKDEKGNWADTRGFFRDEFEK